MPRMRGFGQQGKDYKHQFNAQAPAELRYKNSGINIRLDDTPLSKMTMCLEEGRHNIIKSKFRQLLV